MTFAAQPMTWIVELLFGATTKTEYRNQLMLSRGESSVRFMEFTVAHDYLLHEHRISMAKKKHDRKKMVKIKRIHKTEIIIIYKWLL